MTGNTRTGRARRVRWSIALLSAAIGGAAMLAPVTLAAAEGIPASAPAALRIHVSG